VRRYGEADAMFKFPEDYDADKLPEISTMAESTAKFSQGIVACETG
jgi:hypothetical protein